MRSVVIVLGGLAPVVRRPRTPRDTVRCCLSMVTAGGTSHTGLVHRHARKHMGGRISCRVFGDWDASLPRDILASRRCRRFTISWRKFSWRNVTCGIPAHMPSALPPGAA